MSQFSVLYDNAPIFYEAEWNFCDNILPILTTDYRFTPYIDPDMPFAPKRLVGLYSGEVFSNETCCLVGEYTDIVANQPIPVDFRIFPNPDIYIPPTPPQKDTSCGLLIGFISDEIKSKEDVSGPFREIDIERYQKLNIPFKIEEDPEIFIPPKPPEQILNPLIGFYSNEIQSNEDECCVGVLEDISTVINKVWDRVDKYPDPEIFIPPDPEPPKPPGANELLIGFLSHEIYLNEDVSGPYKIQDINHVQRAELDFNIYDDPIVAPPTPRPIDKDKLLLGYFSGEVFSAEIDTNVEKLADLDKIPIEKRYSEDYLARLIGFYSNEIYSAEDRAGKQSIIEVVDDNYPQKDFRLYADPILLDAKNIIGYLSGEIYSVEGRAGIILYYDLDSNQPNELEFNIYADPEIYIPPEPEPYIPGPCGLFIGPVSKEFYSNEIESGPFGLEDIKADQPISYLFAVEPDPEIFIPEPPIPIITDPITWHYSNEGISNASIATDMLGSIKTIQNFRNNYPDPDIYVPPVPDPPPPPGAHGMIIGFVTNEIFSYYDRHSGPFTEEDIIISQADDLEFNIESDPEIFIPPPPPVIIVDPTIGLESNEIFSNEADSAPRNKEKKKPPQTDYGKINRFADPEIYIPPEPDPPLPPGANELLIGRLASEILSNEALSSPYLENDITPSQKVSINFRIYDDPILAPPTPKPIINPIIGLYSGELMSNESDTSIATVADIDTIPINKRYSEDYLRRVIGFFSDEIFAGVNTSGKENAMVANDDNVPQKNFIIYKDPVLLDSNSIIGYYSNEIISGEGISDVYNLYNKNNRTDLNFIIYSEPIIYIPDINNE